ncbi:winged helix-turn-helix domain-containing protein [Aquamicrobium lusatiense]
MMRLTPSPARIKAGLRRAGHEEKAAPETNTYSFADFEVDPQLRRVTRYDGAEVNLTGAEFDLLNTFLDRPGRLLSRDHLLDLTQGRGRDPLDRSIDALMRAGFGANLEKAKGKPVSKTCVMADTSSPCR